MMNHSYDEPQLWRIDDLLRGDKKRVTKKYMFTPPKGLRPTPTSIKIHLTSLCFHMDFCEDADVIWSNYATGLNAEHKIEGTGNEQSWQN